MGNSEATITEYLIIGSSAGGIGAAEAIREKDGKNSLTIISDEPYPAYSRPLISEYLAGERTVDEMLFRPVDFYSQNNITLLPGKKVKQLDLEHRTTCLESGEQITWNKLLLATGGIPIVPRIEGTDKKGVFCFLTLDNAKSIAEFIETANHAVVIGGGLIGVSVTESLIKLGVNVTILEMKDRILNTILDEEASWIAEDVLKQANVKVITDHTASQITGESSVDGIVLDNGERIDCDLVIMAIGVIPRTELVLDTQIKVNHGIIVDRCMSTNHPDIYSCGDVAEAYDFIHRENRVIPIWPNAYIGGKVAGYNMAGVKAEYYGGTAMNSINYFGLDIVTAGIVNPEDANDCEIISRDDNGIYQKIVLKQDHIIGMVIVKDIEKSGILFGLMKQQVDVTSFKQELLTDHFGIAYFPGEIREQWLATMPSSKTTVLAMPAEISKC